MNAVFKLEHSGRKIFPGWSQLFTCIRKKIMITTARTLFICAVLSGNLARAAEVLMCQDYANLKDLSVHCTKSNEASISILSDTVLPEKSKVLDVNLKKLNPDARAWDVQLIYLFRGTLKKGSCYELSFLCKASEPGNIELAVAQVKKPWKELSGTHKKFRITEKWEKYRICFRADQDWAETLAMPRFMLGKYGAPANIYLGPVSIKKYQEQIPYSLNKEWSVFLNAQTPASFSEIPETLSGSKGTVRKLTVSLKNSSLDMGELNKGFKVKNIALLFNKFQCNKAGFMQIGFAADWWIELYINGKMIFSNLATGNSSHDFTTHDQVIDIPVRAGQNVLAAKVLSGSGGWRFVCGKPDRASEKIFVIRPSQEWKAVNMDKIQIQKETALDFSNLTGTRQPAGTFGRVIVNKNGKLAFENKPDVAVRFFSFNTVIAFWRSQVHKWSKEDIEEFAAAVARQGYNMLRLQSLDEFLLGFKVHNQPRLTFAQAGIPQKAEDIPFDRNNIDKFDYLFACLKKNGIYVNIDFSTRKSGYTMAGQRKPDESFRIQLFFNSQYRKNWEVAVKYLLNHRNPYTGMCLKDDPTLAVVEPKNEQDLLIFSKEHMKVLTPNFRDYLKNKYGTAKALSIAWKQPDITFETVPDISETMLQQGNVKAADAGFFLIKTMSDMTRWYVDVIRKNGYPGLITQWDMIMRTMEIPVRALMPAIAQHTYFCHPGSVPSKKLAKKSKSWTAAVAAGRDQDCMVAQISSMDSSYFRAAAAARFLDRPFLITEYSHSCFNRYRHERGIYFGAYAALQGWDSLAAHGRLPVWTNAYPQDPIAKFERPEDPIFRASEAVVACAWLRGDIMESRHSVQFNLSKQVMFPKHFLAAIGDDYAKLAMLTKIGIAYPEITPLAPVGIAHPDVQIVVDKFSPLQTSSWYATVATENKAFPELLREIRRRGLLSPGNLTNPSNRLYQSDTQEITLNAKDQTMTVCSLRLEGAIIKKDLPVKLETTYIQSCSRPAAVAVLSLDHKKSIKESNSLLLILSTNALNTDMIFENSSMLLLADAGKLPVLMQTVKLDISIVTDFGKVEVYALNLDGSRAEKIHAEVKSNKLHMFLDTANLKYGTPFFEINFQ